MRPQFAERRHDEFRPPSIGVGGNRDSATDNPPDDANLFTVRKGGIDRAAEVENPPSESRPPRAGRFGRTRAAVALAAVFVGVAVVAGTHVETRDARVARPSRHGERGSLRPTPVAPRARPRRPDRRRSLRDPHRGASTSFSPPSTLPISAGTEPRVRPETCGIAAEFGFEACRG